ncbi:hypothetical protein [Halorussus aquaticus]|uniref:Ig-like domain-containing protein n=1 Tax=Halorussus aquaticus TaxID=2953748 RepID=A0ABD5Q0N9_9EURY|nr:hypothetical protein [Halorussus aquaticus]
MADSVFWKGLALLFLVFAVLVGTVVAFGFLGFGQSPPPMDDLRVSNDDDTNHTVDLRIVAANGSVSFERSVRLGSAERVSFDGTTKRGSEYRLRVAVDDREPESFEISGQDDLCTTAVRVEANATVEVVTSCA